MATGRRTLAFLLVAFAARGGVADGQVPTPLVVTIQLPPAGNVAGSFQALVEGTVSDPSVRRAWLTANGLTREVSVSNGRVRESILALPGVNRVSLEATRGGQVGRAEVSFSALGVEAELVVWVTWPADTPWPFLEVVNQTWTICRRRVSWALTFDRHSGGSDCGRSGVASLYETVREAPRPNRTPTSRPVGAPWYGVVIRRVQAERYRFCAGNRYLDHPRPSPGDVVALLSRLDALGRDASPARRAALLAALDQAAAPRASVTPLRVLAVLFPGTSRERRWIFDDSLDALRSHYPIDYWPLGTLGEIEVTEDEVRAVRAGLP